MMWPFRPEEEEEGEREEEEPITTKSDAYILMFADT